MALFELGSGLHYGREAYQVIEILTRLDKSGFPTGSASYIGDVVSLQQSIEYKGLYILDITLNGGVLMTTMPCILSGNKVYTDIDEFVTACLEECTQTTAAPEGDPHAGMVQNPMTGEWSWF